MVKYLRRLGHEVTVMTAAPPGHTPGAEAGVVRTANLNSSPLLRRLLLRPAAVAAQPAASGASSVAASPVLWKGIVPDPWLITWNPYAWRATRRHFDAGSVDCIITSSPSESTHLVPLALGRKRPAWVADFRDGWSFEPLRPAFPTAAQRHLDRRLERRVATSANVVVAVEPATAADFRARFGIEPQLITNGFDLEVEADSALPPAFDPQRFTLVHTGPMRDPRGRDPRGLLAALRRLLDEEPDIATRLQVLVAGRSEFDERALLKEAGLEGLVNQLGHLPRGQAIALQRAAGAVVLITSTELPGKLFEYLACGRPIIALADGNAAARIVEETGTGIVVPPCDPAAIAGAIRSALRGDLDRSYAPHGLEPYTYPAPAKQMAVAVERAIELRRSQADRLP
jgi:glycosyltransferase involved in cell wall biosynthesis